MRLLTDDGGDHYDASTAHYFWNNVSGTIEVVSGIAGATNNCIKIPHKGSNWVRGILGSGNKTEVYFGSRLMSSSFANFSLDLITLMSSTTAVAFRLHTNPGGTISVYDKNNSLIYTSPVVVSNSIFSYVEGHAVINGSSSTLELKQNGVVIQSGITGDFGSEVTFIEIKCGLGQFNGDDAELYIDDTYVNDPSPDADGNYDNVGYEGDIGVYYLPPIGEGYKQDWPFTGAATAPQCIDELVANGDTDYIASINTGEISSFTLQDLTTSGIDVVSCVSPIYLAKSDLPGTPTLRARLYRSGDGLSPTTASQVNTIDTSYEGVSLDHFGRDPITGTSWTMAKVNSIELAIERVG